MSKHTPGTWYHDKSLQHVAAAGSDEDGDIICEAPLAFKESMTRWEANAQLIDAAPELLSTLEKAYEWIGDQCHRLEDPDGGYELHHALRAAIAKARGEEMSK